MVNYVLTKKGKWCILVVQGVTNKEHRKEIVVMVNVEYLLELMRQHGNMTLGQLSIKSGVSKSQLSRILHYKRDVGRKTIEGILKAFPETKLDELFILH